MFDGKGVKVSVRGGSVPMRLERFLEARQPSLIDALARWFPQLGQR
jgi:hypothetical protein